MAILSVVNLIILLLVIAGIGLGIYILYMVIKALKIYIIRIHDISIRVLANHI